MTERQKLRSIYHNMCTRCENKNSNTYKWYGAKGIKVCNEWRKSFQTFVQWAYDNGYQINLTLDRINNSMDYNPENCRWVTREIQSNNISSNVIIEYKGKAQTIAQWAKETGINQSTLQKRISTYKWPVEKALTEPISNKGPLNRPNEKIFQFQDKNYTINELCAIYNMKPDTLRHRLRAGLPLETALKKPI